MTKIGVVGLNYWGPNLVRNFDGLAELTWLCDLDETHLRPIADRYPHARATTELDDMLADDTLDAVVIATPVPTHHALAKRALEAGKHVFVEKPPAMRAVEMDELVRLADDGGRVLMPGHLLLYHPAVLKLKELVDGGELGDVLCVYGNRVNLGIVRSNENALWSLGVHDLSVILYLLDEDPDFATAQGSASIHPGVEDVVFCFLRFPSGKIAHMHLSWLDPHKMRKMTVVGSQKMAVFDDMEPERKVTVYEKSAGRRERRVFHSGDIHVPKVATDRAAQARVRVLPRAGRGEARPRQGRARRRPRRARARDARPTSLDG